MQRGNPPKPKALAGDLSGGLLLHTFLGRQEKYGACRAHPAKKFKDLQGLRPLRAPYSFYLPKKSKQKKGTQRSHPQSPAATAGSLRSADVLGPDKNSLRSNSLSGCSRKRPLRSGGLEWEFKSYKQDNRLSICCLTTKITQIQATAFQEKPQSPP